jgi:hypothetical protein
MKRNEVKITFEDNQHPNKKVVIKIIDNQKMELEFIPETHKDETGEYIRWVNLFINNLF